MKIRDSTYLSKIINKNKIKLLVSFEHMETKRINTSEK